MGEVLIEINNSINWTRLIIYALILLYYTSGYLYNFSHSIITLILLILSCILLISDIIEGFIKIKITKNGISAPFNNLYWKQIKQYKFENNMLTIEFQKKFLFIKYNGKLNLKMLEEESNFIIKTFKENFYC